MALDLSKWIDKRHARILGAVLLLTGLAIMLQQRRGSPEGPILLVAIVLFLAGLALIGQTRTQV